MSNTPQENLNLGGQVPLEVREAGLFVSRGRNRHIERVFEAFVLIFVREGVLHIEEENRAFEVGAGQSLLLWPQRAHRGTQDYAENLQFFWLHFVLSDSNQAPALLNVPQHTTIARPDFVSGLFHRFLDDQNTGRLQPLSSALLVWMILTEISDTRVAFPAHSATALAGRAYAHIRTHFHRKLTASDVAKAVECNPQYLSRVFAQSYGQTLTETIRRVRINHARSLLLHSNRNVGEIARECGFEETAYFQRVFKAQEGVPPLHFRRLHARLKINTE